MTAEGSYSVIRYIPDPGRGESLNVGILLWDGQDFRLNVDDKAIERVIRENPLLERDALLYVEPSLHDRLASGGGSIPDRVERMLASQRGFPIELTEPRFTTLEGRGEYDATLQRLTKRIVRPRRRTGGGGSHPMQAVERRLASLLKQEAVSRNHFFGTSRTGVPRRADFFANSGANVALDVVRLALRRAQEIRLRADAEAFKVYDVLNAENSVRKYFVLCEFGAAQELLETNENARRVIEMQGATVVTDAGVAAQVLADATSHVSA